ncbi:hypothetical protein ACJMK2_000142 [Sinanodonta woodiana]|uniref:RING-type domain-containing protein n=1 Tax=Sinanodonta woodiana TaxID=1069815 RepID=A0ABD3XNH3_SINWO
MATASMLQSERFSQILKCPWCLETFKIPRVLSCGHTYCTSCLQSHININITSKDTLQANFSCLLCAANTTILDHSVETSRLAESFPVNCMVISLLDVKLGMSGRKGCEFCRKRCKEVCATSYCQECHISMCDTCKQYHDDISECDKKNSFSFNEQTELDSVRVRPNLAFIEMCPKHPDEKIKFICKDHQELCCSTCGFLQHRMCDNITTLEDMLRTTYVHIKSKEVETNLNKCNNCLKRIINGVNTSLDALQYDKAAISKKISSVIEHLNKTLVKLERDLTVNVKDIYQAETLTLRFQENKGNNLMTSVYSDLMQLDLVMTKGSEVQQVIALYNLGHRQHKNFQGTSEYVSSVNVIKLTLDIDRNVLDMLNTVDKFGQVLVSRSKFHISPGNNESMMKESNFETESKLKCLSQFETKNIKQSETDSGSDRAEIPLRNKNVVKIAEFNAKSVRDKSLCQISDILPLQGSRLLIVDSMHQKVKILGPDYKCLNCMTFTDCPWNACFISGIDVALTMPYQKTIQVIRIKDKMQTTREIKTKFQCWGISTMKDHVVVTTRGDAHCVLILDWNGTEIRQIMLHNHWDRNKLSYPSSVTTNRSQTVIYVTCHSGLVAYNTNWDILFTYTNQSKDSLGGVDTDRDGQIYLCDSNVSNIQMISSDGKLIRTLLSGKQKPLKIMFYKDRDIFLLTYHNCNVIEIYQFK